MANYTTKILNKKDKYRCNCVKWVRSKIPNLPFGLWTISDKKKIIDSKNAKVGRVAIMDVGRPYGHVGIVTKIEDNKLTIIEANFKSCAVTERVGTKTALKILGFFNPNKKHWNKEQ